MNLASCVKHVGGTVVSVHVAAAVAALSNPLGLPRILHRAENCLQ